MTPLDYQCKICGKPGVAYYDPDCPFTKIESWRSALCCNRCYTFRDRFMVAKRGIEALCISLMNLETMRDRTVADSAKTKIQGRLVELTKRIASLCSDHYRLENIWEMQMVEILMDNPRGCNRAIHAFKLGYSSQVERQMI